MFFYCLEYEREITKKYDQEAEIEEFPINVDQKKKSYLK